MLSAARTILFTIKQLLGKGVPSHILSFGDSLGDNLLLTTLAAELHNRGYKNIWVKCNHHSLFANYPYVRIVLPFNTLLSTTILNALNVSQVRPEYTQYHKETDRDEIPEKHIILKMANCLPLKGPISNKPALFLTAEETEAQKFARNHIVITCSTSGALVPMRNKEWITQRYQQVVDLLHADYQFIQLGTQNDTLLNNVTDGRDKFSVRESAAVLKNALLVITHVGFIMHLARAVDCRAVIIYGGRETPAQSGYTCFTNIYSAVPCSPCWLHNRCDFDKQCMTMITADMVKDAVLKEVQLYGQPLQTDVLIND